jgi:amino acid adenylation domain-containing protein
MPATQAGEDDVGWETAQDRSADEVFWRDLLRGLAEQTPLPSVTGGQVRNLSGQRRGEQETFLPEGTTDDLRRLASSLDVTLNTLVQAAWAILLSRYSGEDDVSFGTVRRTQGARDGETASALGLFINTLPMRVEVDGSMALRGFLHQLRAQHLAIRPHRNTPIVDVRRWSGISGRAGLVNTFIVFNEHSVGWILRSQGGNWHRREFCLIESLSSIPLGLYAYADSNLLLKLIYDRERCDDVSAARVIEHVKSLLSAMIHRADDSVGSLPMLTSMERQLLDEWNSAQMSEVTAVCAHEMVEEQVRRQPNRVALTSRDGEITYRELDRWSTSLACDLRRLGVGPEVIVGIYLRRSTEMVVAVLATLKAGGAYLPLDPDYPRARRDYMLQDAQVKVVLTEASIADDLPGDLQHVVRVERSDAGTTGTPAEAPNGIASSTNLAYLIYTSGSTGNPKGVMVEHRNVANFFRAMDERIGGDSPGVWLAVTSLSFDISVLELLWSLTKGFTVVIYPGDTVDQAADGHTSGIFEVGDYLLGHEITHMQCTPSMALMMTMDEKCRSGMASLQLLLIGGEPFPSALAEELRKLTRAEIVNMYGPTETTIWSSTHSVPDGQEERSAAGSVVAIGRPVINTSFHVLDRHLQPVPPGVAGELFIGGEGVARGYLNLPSLTAERFIPSPFAQESGRLYRTGDLVRYGSDGCVEFLGRIDDQIKLRGYRIEPAEIEQEIQRYPGIDQAAVVAHEFSPGERYLLACIVPSEGMQPSAEQLKESLRRTLPEYMVPAEFIFLDHLPLTPNKKLDRKSLAKLRPATPVSKEGEAPSPGSLESEIAGIWEQVLGPRSIGRDDNFFDLGGDSFLAMKLHYTLRRVLGRELSLVDIFTYPTVRSLADHLGQRSGTGEAIRKAMQRGQTRRMRGLRGEGKGKDQGS